jgi:hypothetical protein
MTGQKLQINIHVRDWIGWALFWLFGGLVISWWSTKVLVNQQQRAAILQQIHDQEPQWLSSFVGIPPVVWVRAVLHQAQKLCDHHWLTSPGLIASNVNGVKNTVSVLEAAHTLRKQLERILDPILYKGAIFALDEVIARIGITPLSDGAMQSIIADMRAFNGWLDPVKFPGAFWKDVQPRVESLLSEMGDEKIGKWSRNEAAVDHRVGVLRGHLNAVRTAPHDRWHAEAIYREYAQLRILWDQRNFGLDELVEPPASEDIDYFFEVADKRLWDRIKKAKPVIRVGNDDKIHGLEAYEVLKFRVEVEDPVIMRSYLFRYKVRCHWKFTWHYPGVGRLRGRWRGAVGRVRSFLGVRDRKTSEYPKHSASIGPVMCWYFLWPGKVTISAVLNYPESDPIKLIQKHLVINRSSDYGGVKVLRGAEVVGWFVAGIIAMVSGLAMFYFKGTSWGTPQDYLALILWGIGVDQGKNFFQALHAFSQAEKPIGITPSPS